MVVVVGSARKIAALTETRGRNQKELSYNQTWTSGRKQTKRDKREEEKNIITAKRRRI